jgi:geranylgeranyl diphosphate synthase type I
VEALRGAIVATGALDDVERLIDGLTRSALEGLDTADLAEPGRTVLADLARAAVDRAS